MTEILWYLAGLMTIPAIVLVAVAAGAIWRNIEREKQEWRDGW